MGFVYHQALSGSCRLGGGVRWACFACCFDDMSVAGLLSADISFHSDLSRCAAQMSSIQALLHSLVSPYAVADCLTGLMKACAHCSLPGGRCTFQCGLAHDKIPILRVLSLFFACCSPGFGTSKHSRNACPQPICHVRCTRFLSGCGKTTPFAHVLFDSSFHHCPSECGQALFGG